MEACPGGRRRSLSPSRARLLARVDSKARLGHAGEDGGEVVVLLHALVVKGEGAAGAGVLVVEVVEAVVARVVHHGGHEQREHRERGGEQLGAAAAAQEVVRGLRRRVPTA